MKRERVGRLFSNRYSDRYSAMDSCDYDKSQQLKNCSDIVRVVEIGMLIEKY